MNEDEIIKKIIAILERDESLPGDLAEKKLAYRYLDEGHIDSFAIMNLIVEIEDIFDISLSPEDTQSDEFRTPGGIVSLVKNRLTK